MFKRIGGEGRQDADKALDAVGLGGLGDRSIGALSAGQFQRVLFARTIVRDAPVILLDEPFSAVDPATEADLMAILHGWHAQGRTIVAVLHDFGLISDAFPDTLLLGPQPPPWGATARVLDAHAPRRGVALEAAA